MEKVQEKPSWQQRNLFTFRGPWGVPIAIKITVLVVPMACGLLALYDPLDGLSIFLTLILAILAHEIGHAWAARRQGLESIRIELRWFGGLCAFDPIKHPSQMVWTVLAGPIANLWIFTAAVCLQALGPSGVWAEVLRYVVITNLFLAVLNFVPALPYDGGQLLRFTLKHWMEDRRVNRIVGGTALTFMVAAPVIFLLLPNFITLFLLFLVHPNLAWRMAMKGEIQRPAPEVLPEPEIREDHPLLVASRRLREERLPLAA